MTTQAVPIGNHRTDTPEFQEMRKGRIGGSEIAAVLGLSPYESHLSLWWRKRGEAPPKTFDHTAQQLVDWGKRYEPTVYAMFLEQKIPGISFYEALFLACLSLGDMSALGDIRREETLDRFRSNHPDQDWTYSPGSYINKQRPWQLASPDAIRSNPTEIVEVKTVQNELDWGDEGTDQIPVYYRTQCIWYMSALGARVCWIPTLIRGAFYKEYKIEWTEEVAADAHILIDAGREFIQSLADDVQPPIDGHDETYKVVRERHPDIEAGDIVIPQDLIDAYLAAVLEERSAKEIRQRWASEIMELMGKTRNATDQEGNRVAFRKPASNGARIPFLAVDPALMRSLKPKLAINGNGS